MAERGGGWRKGEFVRWTDLLIILEAFLVWLGLALLTALAVFAVLRSHGMAPGAAMLHIAPYLKSYGFYQAINASLYLVMLLFFLRVAWRVAPEALVARFGAAAWPQIILATLAGMALALSVPLLSAYLVHTHAIELTPSPGELRLVPHNAREWGIALITVAVVAPLVEELYFRGLILSWLRRKMPAAPAVAISAALFGLIHFGFIAHPGSGGWYVTGILTLVGALAAVLAIQTRSLWTCFALHGAYNATLISLPMLPSLLR